MIALVAYNHSSLNTSWSIHMALWSESSLAGSVSGKRMNVELALTSVCVCVCVWQSKATP